MKNHDIENREIENKVDATDVREQDALDQMIADGQSLPEAGNEYLAVYKNLGRSTARLPSNFSHLVMRKIIQLKIERARSGALSQSVLVSVITSLLGVSLLMLYALYSQTSVFAGLSLPTIQTLLLPIGGGLTLMMLIVFDGFYSSTSHRVKG